MRCFFSITVLSLSLWGCSSSGGGGSYGNVGVIGSPFISTSTSSAIIKGSRSFGATYTERKTAIDTLLAAATADACNFTIDLAEVSQYANCYGPNLTLEGNHPNTGILSNPNSLPGGDLGIWDEKNGGTEACAAAQITKLIDAHAGRAHFANLSGAALWSAVEKLESEWLRIQA